MRPTAGHAPLLALLLAVAPSPPTAQSVVVTGRLLHRGRTDRPVVNQWVVLRAVRPDTGGPVDSARTDGAGRYRLTFARDAADTAVLHFVSTTYQGVDYFSHPLGVVGNGRLEVEPVIVYDTTSAGPPMRLERRLLVLYRADAQPGLGVIELIEVANPGDRTRIAPDTLTPVWTLRLPTGVTGWEVREGNLAPETIWRARDTVKVFAPIWPGMPLHASYEYALSGRDARFPIDQWTGEVDLLVEDTTAVPAGATFERLGVHDREGRRFAAYRAGPLEAGAEVRLALSGGPLRAEDAVPYLVAGAALALAWGLWVALRRRAAGVS